MKCVRRKKFRSRSLRKLHDKQSNVNEEPTFAKQQLGNETGNLLGMKWDKEADTIQVIIPPDESTDSTPTKRGILGKFARIFDPLGLIAPTTLQGKLLYRETCEHKCKWDDELPVKLSKHWQKWERGLPGQIKVPRSVPLALEPIHDIALDTFDDASGHRVGAAGTNNPSCQAGTYNP